MGDVFEVVGGKKLSGSLTPQGAKNEALQVICATLLTDKPVILENLPAIEDVIQLIQLLQGLGVEIQRIDSHTYSFCAKDIRFEYIESAEYFKTAGKIRGSVMLVGAMLSRCGRALLPKPGGDKIGRRRLDTHFNGLQELGAQFNFNPDTFTYHIDGGHMRPGYVLMEEISVTGTANLILASVKTKGTTQIFNAACEPYIQQLCRLLSKMGAKIHGIGSNLLTIEGVDILYGATHRVLPDMIEIGSFIGLAAMTQSHIRIKNAGLDHLGQIPSVFRKLGIQMEFEEDDIVIPSQDSYEVQNFIDGSILTLYDAPWPGFSPDLMSIALVVATQAKGSVLLHQKMFESRLFFVDKLIDMGAQIILCDPHRATVIGLGKRFPLRGIEMTSPDIRAGVALLIAALSASGKSVIHNVHQIDRGYERIEERLNAIGAEIVRK